MKTKPKSKKVKSSAPNSPKPLPNPMTVMYQDLPEGMIVITGFGGILTEKVLIDKYGEYIARLYLGYEDSAKLLFGDEGAPYLQVSYLNFLIGDVLPKKELNTLFKMLQKAGKLLHDVIWAITINPIKSLKI